MIICAQTNLLFVEMMPRKQTNKTRCVFKNHDNDPANKTNMMLAAMLERYSVKFCGDDGDAADARRSVVAPEALSLLRRSSQRPVTV